MDVKEHGGCGVTGRKPGERGGTWRAKEDEEGRRRTWRDIKGPGEMVELHKGAWRNLKGHGRTWRTRRNEEGC